MDLNKLKRASVQFDYFSDNFSKFRGDFYTFSNMTIPLPFLADKLLFYMSDKQINYFQLPAGLTKDNKDRYFIFKVQMQPDNQQLRTYKYICHSLTNNVRKNNSSLS